MSKLTTLKRNLGPVLLMLFGLGNILGAGIYVLIGKVAGEAGYFAPVAFVIAAAVAGLSAFSYAELSARLPEAGGEVVYMERAFAVPLLSIVIGLMIAMAGVLSASTILRGFAGYLQVFWALPTSWIIVGAGLLIGSIAIWGVKESLQVAAALTLVEILGLLMIIVPGMDIETLSLARLSAGISPSDSILGAGVLAGAFLAFYAFIGFEDMVNLAEEVENPSRNMPIAIIAALVISTLLYMLVALVAVSYLSPDALGRTGAPLAEVFKAITGNDPYIITIISLFAVTNGALVQTIMVSRLLYGMGRRHRVFRVFFRVNPVTRTPLLSTLVAVGAVLTLALWFPLRTLAEYTSTVVLTVFIFVNAALIKLRRDSAEQRGWVATLQPWLGIVATVFLLMTNLYSPR